MSVGSLTFDRMKRFTSSGGPLVSITVAEAKGSTPRKEGTTMLVSADGNDGTIGGGQLEFEAIALGREMLAVHGESDRWVRTYRGFPLGPGLGQCCGGHVSLLFEVWGAGEKNWLAGALEQCGAEPVLLARDMAGGGAPMLIDARQDTPDLPIGLVRAAKNMLAGTSPVGTVLHKGDPGFILTPIQPEPIALYLYGAGHVGRAVVHVLKDTGFHINWVDLDADRFPDDVPDYVTKIPARSPALIASHAHDHAWHLVMTRSHSLDLEICHALLKRGDFAYLGMIGSRTKAVRFDKRLGELGIDKATRGQMICPVGLNAGITGKTSNAPSAIALSVAADFMLRLESLARIKPVGGRIYHD